MGFTNELESSQFYIRLTMGFDEFSMTSVKSGLTIERLNYTITAPRIHIFILLDRHYILLGVTNEL